MNDAISRSALLDCARKVVSYNSAHLDINAIYVVDVEDIEYASPLDVAPVVHARWSRDAWNDLRCSHCKERIPYKHCYCEEDDNEWDEEIAQTPWCMYCGARMDGEADD